MTRLLLFTGDADKAEAELLAQGGRVLSRYTDQVFSAEVSEETDLSSLRHSASDPIGELTEESKFAMSAWSAGNASFLEADPPRAWDAPGLDYPRNPHNDAEMAREQEKSALGLTGYPAVNSFLIGPTAVGVIMVSGPKDKQLDLSDADRTHLLSQVQLGLNGLAAIEPRAKVSFIYETRHITVSAEAGPG